MRSKSSVFTPRLLSRNLWDVIWLSLIVLSLNAVSPPSLLAQVPASEAVGDKPVNLGPGIEPPRLMKTVPAAGSSVGTEVGIVFVSLVVDTTGLPTQIRVVRSVSPDLDQKAIEAVRQYRFKPAMKKGKPIAVKLNLEVDYQTIKSKK